MMTNAILAKNIHVWRFLKSFTHHLRGRFALGGIAPDDFCSASGGSDMVSITLVSSEAPTRDCVSCRTPQRHRSRTEVVVAERPQPRPTVAGRWPNRRPPRHPTIASDERDPHLGRNLAVPTGNISATSRGATSSPNAKYLYAYDMEL